MSTILLTGATGYLGQRLLKRLVNDGQNVLCPVFADAHRITVCNHSGYITVDTKSPKYQEMIVSFCPEVIINTAGVYDRGGNSVAQLTLGNLLFPLDLLNMIISNSNNRLKLFINTCTSMPCHFNAYTESKHQLAYWGRVYSERLGFAFVNVKLEHFYGSFDNNIKFIQNVIERLFANAPIDLTIGTQERDFVHIDDVVDGFMCILNGDLQGYADIPLGSGMSAKICEVVEYMKNISGSLSALNFGKIPLRENEPMKLVANIGIIKALGFTPKYDWQSGLYSVINEMRGKL